MSSTRYTRLQVGETLLGTIIKHQKGQISLWGDVSVESRCRSTRKVRRHEVVAPAAGQTERLLPFVPATVTVPDTVSLGDVLIVFKKIELQLHGMSILGGCK